MSGSDSDHETQPALQRPRATKRPSKMPVTGPSDDEDDVVEDKPDEVDEAELAARSTRGRKRPAKMPVTAMSDEEDEDEEDGDYNEDDARADEKRADGDGDGDEEEEDKAGDDEDKADGDADAGTSVGAKRSKSAADGDNAESKEERPAKRQRLDPRKFLDDKAAVEGDMNPSDDEEPEDDGEDEEELLATLHGEETGGADAEAEEEEEEEEMSDITAARRFNVQAEEEDVEKIRKEAERYQKMETEGYVGNDLMEEAQSRKEASLPSVKDPKLWLVKCDPGKEQEAVLALMRKFYTKRKTSEPLFIKSAFCTPAAKGYVYVEADKEAHVKHAIFKTRMLKSWKMILVPINQMVHALRADVKSVPVKKWQWVRMARGEYKGDLAQVVATEDQNTRITVKLVPRLDITALKAQFKEKSEGPDPEKQKDRKRFSALRRKGPRPPQRLFNAEEIKELGNVVERKRADTNKEIVFDVFKGNKYRNGYLYRDVPASALIFDDVHPMLEEIQKFSARVSGEEDDVALDEQKEAAHSLAKMETEKKQSAFSKGDRVKVTQGDLINLLGTVVSVTGDQVNVKHTELPQPLPYQATQLRKVFSVGDHVKVVAGSFKDETGMVVKVMDNDNVVVIFSDISSREMKVFAKDVIESSEVTTGRDTLGNFDLYDMVQLSPEEVGVIIKVEMTSFKVLTNRNTVKTVRIQDAGKKRNSKFASALDSRNNQIQEKDVVEVYQGPAMGRKGVVKHIFRSTLFVHSPSVSDNAGLFVCQARHCGLVGLTQHVSQSSMASPQVGMGANYGGQGAQRKGAPSGPRSTGRFRDPKLNKIVTIIKGPNKGLTGLVVDATLSHYRVNLHAMAKTLNLAKDSVKLKEEVVRATPSAMPREPEEEHEYYGLGGQTPHIGGATPAYASQTPHYAPRTPMREDGSATPHYSGSQTPGHEVWNPTTPHYQSSTPAHTWQPRTPKSPTHPRSPKSPSATTPYGYNATTPGDHSLDTPSMPTPTPGFTPTPRTPKEPATPATPYDRDSPYTPHTPHTPAPPPADTPMGGDDDEDTKWIVVNACCTFEGKEAVVQQIVGGSVKILLDNNLIKVNTNEIQPVEPQQTDRVYIWQGPNANKSGKLIHIDLTDGVVRLDTSGANDDIVIDPMKRLVKLANA